MKVHICDRCGKIRTKSSKYPTNGRIHGGYIDGIAYTNQGSVDAVSDLCDVCLDDLFEFMTYDEGKQKHDDQ